MHQKTSTDACKCSRQIVCRWARYLIPLVCRWTRYLVTLAFSVAGILSHWFLGVPGILSHWFLVWQVSCHTVFRCSRYLVTLVLSLTGILSHWYLGVPGILSHWFSGVSSFLSHLSVGVPVILSHWSVGVPGTCILLHLSAGVPGICADILWTWGDGRTRGAMANGQVAFENNLFLNFTWAQISLEKVNEKQEYTHWFTLQSVPAHLFLETKPMES